MNKRYAPKRGTPKVVVAHFKEIFKADIEKTEPFRLDALTN